MSDTISVDDMGSPALTLGLERRFCALGADGSAARSRPARRHPRTPHRPAPPLHLLVGHLPAFAWNHVCRGLLRRPSFNPRFDEVFDRGIDPDVDDPARCHDHPEVPDAWPSLREIRAYRDRVRAEVLASLDEVAEAPTSSVMAGNGRVLLMALEHEQMHQETLLYMMQRLPLGSIVCPGAIIA